MFEKYKAVMFGVEGPTLTGEEVNLFRQSKPLGFCLFARNIKTKEQVRDLVVSLKEVVGNPHAPILIDQEGGRVSRLKAPIWYEGAAAEVFGQIAEINLADASRALEINFILVAMDMVELGINIDAVPVIDVPVPGAHGVIGDRAFSSDKTIVAALGRVVVDTLTAHGIVPVIKHIPGHGRAEADSHTNLPVVSASLETLIATDFYPFIELNYSPFAMTAHVVYSAIDPNQPATFSQPVIDVVRARIGFNGLILTDCITMEALNGSMGERARRSIEAGCDIVLFSRFKNMELEKLVEVDINVPFIDDKQAKLLEATLVQGVVSAYDKHALYSELKEILTRHKVQILAALGQDPTDREEWSKEKEA